MKQRSEDGPIALSGTAPVLYVPAGQPRIGAGQEVHRPAPTLPVEGLTSDLVFNYVCDYIAQQGYPPSMRNIARACQLSPSAVLYNLDKLEAWGWLAREPGVARSLRILRTRPR